VCYSTKLEKLQLDAARIVTGLPIFTKTDKLYSETGWTTLSSTYYTHIATLVVYTYRTWYTNI
jgi:peptide methionine sulfoxide reductase MsrB